MSHKLDLDTVKYACTCGLLKPISQLYFCRHCSQLRCAFCVCHEVDSHYCGKCSENMPSSEAWLKKNRCGNCYICPCCQQELSTRVASRVVSNPEDTKTTTKKMHYLSCLFCRWNSRDVGIPDQSSVTGNWPERVNIHAEHLGDGLEKYKNLVQAQKHQSENYKKKQRIKYISYTERTGITAAALRKRIGLPEVTHPLFKNRPQMPEFATATEEVDDLPEELLTTPVNLMTITTVEQRLLIPEIQPVTVDKMFLVHKQLSVKRSLRCKSCEHNVSKPEYNPSSVKFKIQLFAYYHIPEVRLVTVEPLRAGQACKLILRFTNPTQHETTVRFLAVDGAGEGAEVAEMTEEFQQSLTVAAPKSLGPSSGPNSLMELSRPPSIVVEPREVIQEVNCDVEIPESSFVLPQRDDAAEYDDFGDSHNIQDDPKLVIRRKSNKAFVNLTVVPRKDLTIGTELFCGFVMQHVYTNTIASTAENKQPQRNNHNVKVFVRLGCLVGSE